MNFNGLKKSLNLFLENEIRIFTDRCGKNNGEFVNYYSTKIFKKNLDKEEILRLFYFNRFFSLIFDKEIKSKNFDSIPLNKDNRIINSIEDLTIEKYFHDLKKKNFSELYPINLFFEEFGNYRNSFITKFHNSYINNFKEITEINTHLDIMTILMKCEYKGEWENKCFDLIKIFDKSEKLNKKQFFLLFHFHDKFKEKENYYQIDFHLSRNPIVDNNITETKTQLVIGRYLNDMGIEYLSEWQEDGFSYDYYLPDYNIVLEYDGPVHYYPLQTQYLEKYKFRFRMINDLFQRKIVYIPYFEWSKLEIDSFCEVYLRKILFSQSDYKESNCFKENYDLNNVDRILI